MNTLCCAATLWLSGSVALLAQGSPPLWQAHAHNDYLHNRPLADALAHGFRSVEADIWLTNGVLLVAHDLAKTVPEKTLDKLYLEPLRSFVRTNSPGHSPPITLLIDVKSDAVQTYAALRPVLARFTDMLTRFESNVIHSNAVMVILSGERAENVMKNETVRLAGIDGRLPDLAANPPPALYPLVSDNWTKHFQWRGTGPMAADEQKKLRDLVRLAHLQGRRLRLWAAPDSENGWQELLDAGVDLINTDKLAELEAFLRKRRTASQ